VIARLAYEGGEDIGRRRWRTTPATVSLPPPLALLGDRNTRAAMTAEAPLRGRERMLDVLDVGKTSLQHRVRINT